MGCCAAYSGGGCYDRRQRPAVQRSISGRPTQEPHRVGDGNLVEWSMLAVGRRRRASRPDRRRCGSSPPSYSAQRTSLEWHSSSSYQAFQVGGVLEQVVPSESKQVVERLHGVCSGCRHDVAYRVPPAGPMSELVA
jgi:hypothetical protein